MAELIVEIKKFQKKLSGFQDIPKGDVDVAYLFFQPRNNARFVVAAEKKKVLETELRMGKYDRIMTTHRGQFTTTMEKKITCAEDNHWFCVSVQISYYVKALEYSYKNKADRIRQRLLDGLSGMEFELGGRLWLPGECKAGGGDLGTAEHKF